MPGLARRTAEGGCPHTAFLNEQLPIQDSESDDWNNVSDLHSILDSALIDRYTKNAARVRELAAPLTSAQFWQKPFPFGNSFGHLVLHLTGNLNYYIGAQIAKTGYVRDRPREFNDPNPPSKDGSAETSSTPL